MWPFKNKDALQIPHITPIEMAYIEGVNSGFKMGLEAASTLDDTAKKKIRELALNEALKIYNDNKKNK